MLQKYIHLRPRRNTVRRYLAVAAVVVLLPTYAVVGWLVVLSARAERAQLETNAANKAIEIGGAVDRETVNLTNIAMSLAESRFLASLNLTEFHHQASNLARQLNLQIVLSSAAPQKQLMNTAVPWGAPLRPDPPPLARETAELALLANKPVLSDLFFAPLRALHVVVAATPVPSAEPPRRVLMVALDDRKILGLLERAQLEPDYLVTVLDRGRTIVARSEKHAEFVGRRVLRGEFDGEPGEMAGVTVVLAPNLEGVPYRWSAVRTKEAGWTVSVGVPLAVLNAPLATAQERLAMAGALLAVCAMLFVNAFGNYLARRTGELGKDRPPNRAEFETMFETAPYGVMVTDMSGCVVLLNERISRMFKASREHLCGGQVADLIIGVPTMQLAFDAVSANPDAWSRGETRELSACRLDGEEFPVEVGLNPLHTDAGTFVVVTVVDISNRKRNAELLENARRERERLHLKLIEASEEERRRLARELHDETGQLLTAATLSLKGLEMCVVADGKPRVLRMQELLDHLGQSLHQIAYQLRPTSLDDLGLREALANHVSEWSSRTGIEVDFHCRRWIEASSTHQDIAIYRTVQETLTNIAKHAHGATQVGVVLDAVEGELRMTIEDNGCGFNVALADGPTSRGGMGVSGMRERLALIGGDLEIESTLGRGTTVYTRVPLQRAREVV